MSGLSSTDTTLTSIVAEIQALTKKDHTKLVQVGLHVQTVLNTLAEDSDLNGAAVGDAPTSTTPSNAKSSSEASEDPSPVYDP